MEVFKMSSDLAEKQTDGLIYLRFNGVRHPHEYDAFGCCCGETVLYYLTTPEGRGFPLYECRRSELTPPLLASLSLRRLKPVDPYHRVPITPDPKLTAERVSRFRRNVALNFNTTLLLKDDHPVLQLERSFREKMADSFYRSEQFFNRSPRPESPKVDKITELYDIIIRLREDVASKSPCALDLNRVIQVVNQIVDRRLPSIGYVGGDFTTECLLSIHSVSRGIKIQLSSGIKVHCDDPGVFKTLSNEDLRECLELLTSRTTERDQMTDIKRQIVEQLVENEKHH